MGVYIPYTRLPSAYQEVEYIQSSGSQYINTGTTFSNNTTVDLDIAFTSARSGWSGIIGNQDYNVNRSWAIGIGTNAMTYQQNRVYVDFSFSPTLNQKYKFTTTGSKIYRDGTNVGTISASIGTFTTPGNACIFKINPSSGGFPYNLSGRLYGCKIYESGTLKRDFVPCYRKSDSVIGVYDLVNSVFYTNSGTGTFSKGNNVYTSELKNAYIGECGWIRPSNLKGGYWRLDGNMNDSSGNGHTGSGTANYTTDRNGTANGAYNASSTSYYVSVPNSSELYMTNGESFSLGFWIKPSYSSGTYSTRGVISMTQNIDSYKGWSIHEDGGSGNRQFRTNNGSMSSTQLSSLTWSSGEWFHFVITYDGSTVRYYKNGILLNSFNRTVGNCDTTYPLTIGYATTWSSSGQAIYQDVFYMKNYCLDNTEVSTIYNKGIAL